jgi:hypothetical protein
VAAAVEDSKRQFRSNHQQNELQGRVGDRDGVEGEGEWDLPQGNGKLKQQQQQQQQQEAVGAEAGTAGTQTEDDKARGGGVEDAGGSGSIDVGLVAAAGTPFAALLDAAAAAGGSLLGVSGHRGQLQQQQQHSPAAGHRRKQPQPKPTSPRLVGAAAAGGGRGDRGGGAARAAGAKDSLTVEGCREAMDLAELQHQQQQRKRPRGGELDLEGVGDEDDEEEDKEEDGGDDEDHGQVGRKRKTGNKKRRKGHGWTKYQNRTVSQKRQRTQQRSGRVEAGTVGSMGCKSEVAEAGNEELTSLAERRELMREKMRRSQQLRRQREREQNGGRTGPRRTSRNTGVVQLEGEQADEGREGGPILQQQQAEKPLNRWQLAWLKRKKGREGSRREAGQKQEVQAREEDDEEQQGERGSQQQDAAEEQPVLNKWQRMWIKRRANKAQQELLMSSPPSQDRELRLQNRRKQREEAVWEVFGEGIAAGTASTAVGTTRTAGVAGPEAVRSGRGKGRGKWEVTHALQPVVAKRRKMDGGVNEELDKGHQEDQRESDQQQQQQKEQRLQNHDQQQEQLQLLQQLLSNGGSIQGGGRSLLQLQIHEEPAEGAKGDDGNTSGKEQKSLQLLGQMQKVLHDIVALKQEEYNILKQMWILEQKGGK